jgi:hypothetical protein
MELMAREQRTPRYARRLRHNQIIEIRFFELSLETFVKSVQGRWKAVREQQP